MKNGIETRLPTNTAMPIRLCAFQPTRRPQQIIKTVQTAYGSITVDGKLGQAHADLIECVMFYAERSRIENERLEVIVDPHKIRMAMGGGSSKYSAEQMSLLEKDLLKALLDTNTPTVNIMGHILERVVEAKITKNDPRAWSSADERSLQCWIFSPEWTELIQSDISRYYDPKPLCRIDYGSVSAVARHVLTHQHQPNGGWKLEGLIKAAGVERQASKVKREMGESVAELSEMGIRMDGDRVFLAAPAPSLAAPAPSLAAPAPSLAAPAPFFDDSAGLSDSSGI